MGAVAETGKDLDKVATGMAEKAEFSGAVQVKMNKVANFLRVD